MWYGSFMDTIFKWMIISFWNIDIMLTMPRYIRVSLLIFIITYFFNYDEYHDLCIWIAKTYTDRFTEIQAKYIVRWKLLDLWYDVVKLCSTVIDTLHCMCDSTSLWQRQSRFKSCVTSKNQARTLTLLHLHITKHA